jgi:hypothetical protein
MTATAVNPDVFLQKEWAMKNSRTGPDPSYKRRLAGIRTCRGRAVRRFFRR